MSEPDGLYGLNERVAALERRVGELCDGSTAITERVLQLEGRFQSHEHMTLDSCTSPPHTPRNNPVVAPDDPW